MARGIDKNIEVKMIRLYTVNNKFAKFGGFHSCWKGPDGYVTIGGREYPYLRIANKYWLMENLDYAFDGLTIGGSSSGSEMRANYYDNDEENNKKCGLLYNGVAVKYLDANRDALLPDGWRVMTVGDFGSLLSYISGLPGYKVTRILKSKSWDGFDLFGFNLLPAGTRNAQGNFTLIDSATYLWTSTTLYSYLYEYTIGSGDQPYNNFTNVAIQSSLRLVKDVEE